MLVISTDCEDKMPRARPEPWDYDQRQKAKALMTKFCGDRETVCAVMGCKASDLAWLCQQAFGMNYTTALRTFELEGKAILKMAYFDAAVDDKNSKALDLMAREHLGMLGPVERRRKVKAEVDARAKETDF